MRANLIVAGAAALTLIASTCPAQKDKGDALKPGDTVKELKFKTLDGKEMNLQGIKKGTILVLNFWATF